MSQWIVLSHAKPGGLQSALDTTFYGPFETKKDAVNWIKENGEAAYRYQTKPLLPPEGEGDDEA